MPNSHTCIWIHATFAVQFHASLIRVSIEKEIHEHIAFQFHEQKCPVKIVNGTPDHVHVLFRLNPNISVSEIIKHVKGHTSHWINGNNLIPEKFAWQKGYSAYSVSDAEVLKICEHIRDQKQLHRNKTYFQEIEALASVRQAPRLTKWGNIQMD